MTLQAEGSVQGADHRRDWRSQGPGCLPGAMAFPPRDSSPPRPPASPTPASSATLTSRWLRHQSPTSSAQLGPTRAPPGLLSTLPQAQASPAPCCSKPGSSVHPTPAPVPGSELSVGRVIPCFPLQPENLSDSSNKTLPDVLVNQGSFFFFFIPSRPCLIARIPDLLLPYGENPIAWHRLHYPCPCAAVESLGSATRQGGQWWLCHVLVVRLLDVARPFHGLVSPAMKWE